MYKALVVDDERMIRMGIRKAVPWEKIGVGKVFTAGSGSEALDILKKEKPQIMVTDIQMREMTGLELISAAREEVPQLRVIVLTGYDKFEYARQSLRLQVQDFFLKPIDEKDLTEAVSMQVRILNEQFFEEKNEKNMRRIQGSAQQTKLEKIMRDIICNRGTDKQQLIDILKNEFLFDTEQDLELVMIAPTLYSNQRVPDENFRAMSVKNVCMDMVDARDKGITFTNDEGAIIIVYFENSQGESILEETAELSDILKDEFDSKPKISVGSRVHGFENLMISYNDAKFLLENEKENIRDIMQTLGARNKAEIFRDIYAELKGIMCGNIGNSAYVMKAFRTFAKAVKSYNLSAAAVRRYCFEIASSLYFSYMEDSGENAKGTLDSLSRSLASTDREEACEVCRMFIEQLLGNEEENLHHIITDAKHYIEEHLTDDISVSSIAAILFITPNYFSRLFKRITGEGCNEYIVRKRIEKAQSLLESTSLRTGKIAMMVGYRDTNYFSLAFKKHTGKSPTKYREEIQKSTN